MERQVLTAREDGRAAAPHRPAWGAPPPAPTPPRTRRGVLVRAGTAVAVAGVMALLGHRSAALVLLTVVSVLSVVSLRFPIVAQTIDRLTDRFQVAVGRVLTTIILSIFYVLVIVPVYLVLRLVRHDPLALGSSVTDASFWRTAVRRNPPLHTRPFTDERHPPVAPAAGSAVARGRLLRVRAALGLLVLLAAADVGVGAGMDRLVTDADERAAAPVNLQVPDVAARQGEPWAQALFDELARSYDDTRYHPFRGWTVPDYDGEYLQVVDEARTSYRAQDIDTERAVKVQFFGGSTTMGWFQRDEHTIPSEFARLAEADGIPVEVVNYGQPAYQNWQEVLLLQEVVTRGEAPDLAVFYDGSNELNAQFLAGPSDDPIHLQSRTIEDRLEKSSASAPSGEGLRRMYDGYADLSAVHRLARAATAKANSTEPQAVGPMESPWPDQAVRPEERGRAAARLHRRGVDLAQSLGEGFGFETAFFWQPFVYTRGVAVEGEEDVIGSWGTDPAAWTAASDAARAGIHPSVIDISDAFTDVDEPLYYDYVHTNERGAELVAKEMYDRLRPQLLELAQGAP